MKSKNALFLSAAVICIALLAGGAYFIFNSIFPRAKPVSFPPIENIASVYTSCNTTMPSIPFGAEEYGELISFISQANPTRKISVNDTPTETYYMIEIETAEKNYCYFLYKDGAETYLEIPYEGIYRADPKFFDCITDYYSEG